MHQTKDIPIEFLRECFEYDPETGILTWKERPLEHFLLSRLPENDTIVETVSPERSRNRFNTRYAGTQVGTLNRGYLQTRLTINGERHTTVNVHRICWALATGEWPKNEINHINSIHNDNRLCNLEDATRSENQSNPNDPLRKSNRSGYRGVFWSIQYQKWIAILRIKGRQEWLGKFDTPEEASKVYLDALSRKIGK